MHIGMLCGGRFVNRPYINLDTLKSKSKQIHIKENPHEILPELAGRVACVLGCQ